MTSDEWNAEHPMGTPMLYHPVRGDMRAELVWTRSPAWELFVGGYMVVKVSGHAGGVLTEHLQPLPDDMVMMVEHLVNILDIWWSGDRTTLGEYMRVHARNIGETVRFDPKETVR